MTKQERKGFTLVELLIFVAIFSVIIGSFITILVTMVRIQASQSVSGEVTQQSQFLIQQLQSYVNSARLVDLSQDVATGTLVLREPIASSSYDPLTFSLASGTVYIQEGATGTPAALTSNKVTVSNLSFTRHYSMGSSSALGVDSVSYSFTMSGNTGLQSQYAESFRSSAVVALPVPQVALLQQVKAENNAASNTSLVTAFPTANEVGDLLLAIVAYQGTGTSSISDTQGNIWVQIASTTTLSPVGTLVLYASFNAAAGVNTATIAFASGATYTSAFLYEYRGAMPISAFDTWGVKNQTSTASPTSPTVSPTSTVELFIGVADNSGPVSATFSPGTGYTLETSSTAMNTTQVSVEDSNQYVTGAVSAPWTSSVSTTSTALIATFKTSGVGHSYDYGAIGHWALDEGTNTVAYDSSIKNTSGTWNGSASGTNGTYYTAGKIGPYAGYFDGSSTYVTFGDPALFQVGNGTISAWFKTGNAGSGFRPIIAKQQAYGMFLSGNVFGIWDWGGGGWKTAGTTLADNTWHFVACSFQSGVASGTTCYVDGVFNFTTSMTVNSQGTSLYIGYGNTGGQYFTGAIDDPRIYNRILTPSEIQAMYNVQH